MALPFRYTRSNDVFTLGSFTSTIETINGLLRLDGDSLTVQWRLRRETGHYGPEVRTDTTIDPVRVVTLPVRALAGARLSRPWWRRWGALDLTLTARDLEAFEPLVGSDALQLAHPAQLVVRVDRRDHDAAREFVTDLALAAGDRAIAEASGGAHNLPRR